jgi:hypothetical protein
VHANKRTRGREEQGKCKKEEREKIHLLFDVYFTGTHHRTSFAILFIIRYSIFVQLINKAIFKLHNYLTNQIIEHV